MSGWRTSYSAAEVKERRPRRLRVRCAVRWLVRGLVSVLTLAIVGPLVAELALRAAGIGVTTRPFIRKAGCDGRPIYVYNKDVFSRFIENVDRRLWDLAEFDVAAAKPREAYRVFVFGGGQGWGWVDSSSSFSHMLEVMLRAAYPAVRFEVYNTAFPFMNSHAMRLIAEGLPPLRPDLLIVYAGGNECIGAFRPNLTPDAVPFVPRRTDIDTNVFLSDFRLLQVLGGWKHLPLATPQSMGPVVVYPDDPLLEGVKENFRFNLDAICRVGHQVGASVLLCGEGANVRDWPPLPCRHQTPLTPERLNDWTRAFDQGKALEQAGDYTAAAESFKQAAEIDATYAEVPFRLGRCFWALGRYDEARELLFRAFDMDAFCWARAHQWSFDVMKDLARIRGPEGVRFVDGARRMAERSPHGVPGSGFFGDQVHMTFTGSYEIACLLFEHVQQVLPESIRAQGPASPVPLSIDACRERLAFDPVTEAPRLEAGIAQYRIIGVAGPLEMENRLEEVRKEAQSSPPLHELARKAAVSADSDFYALARWIDCAPMPECEEALRRLLAAYPNRRVSLRAAGRVLARLGRIADADAAYRTLVTMYPDDARGYVEWGWVYRGQNNLDMAERKFGEACRVDPTDESACIARGNALETLNKPEAAMAVYRKGIAECPWAKSPYQNLERLLAARGTPEASEAEWRGLIERYPGVPRAYFHLATAMEKNGKLNEAVALLEQAVLLDAGNLDYRSRLAEMKAKQQASPNK